MDRPDAFAHWHSNYRRRLPGADDRLGRGPGDKHTWRSRRPRFPPPRAESTGSGVRQLLKRRRSEGLNLASADRRAISMRYDYLRKRGFRRTGESITSRYPRVYYLPQFVARVR